jgi:hypothetical protein
MTSRKWKDHNGNAYKADITKDYKGNDIDYGTFYFKRGNKYFEAYIQSEQVAKKDEFGNDIKDS